MLRKREQQEREEMEEKSQTGSGREMGGGGGAERQKVRNRGVLMAVCRAGLLGIQGVVGAEGLLCVCVDRCMRRGMDGVMGGRWEVKDHWCPAGLFLGPSLEQYRLVANNNPGGNVGEDVYNAVRVCVCFQKRGYP